MFVCPVSVQKTLRNDLKKKNKKQDIVPLSVDLYPPTIKREVLIRDNFDFFSTPYPPYRKRDISEKKFGSQANL